ncbi:MAG: ATP-dependent zinc metalloprotease FtsH, partial [Candidatus Onthomonas sp.]|nr:ATP-dependent zinc metalloprotease FtsH [Candidatus Onthomonas sp.]
MKRTYRSLLPYLLLALAVVALVSLWDGLDSAPTVSYNRMVQLLEEEQVKTVTVRDNEVTLELTEPVDGQSTVQCSIHSFETFYSDLNDLVRQQWQDGVITDYYYYPDSATPWWVEIMPTLIMGLLVFLIFVFLLRQQSAGQNGAAQFGRARTVSNDDPNAPKVTFKDVAGAEEEKEELQEIVDFLRDPGKFNRLGARIPKGVLLVGPPGTGKTLLAKAVAGEADVRFLSISGSDFVELYVGVGASRVRDLFEQAKKSAPAIVFIDEIDAVGRQRGTGLGGGHDEREQTLNQLLVEMDGFAGNTGVIVMAATNRQDILDPALLRPGRFDRQIYVGYPDIKGREGILKVHSRKKPLSDDVDLHVVAQATGGFTGADLENLMNEGALLAARRDQPVIRMGDLHEAMIKVIAGPEKKSQVVTPQAKRLTAYHEAGHAVAMRFLPTQDPVHQITIVPRGKAGGLTISLPQEDKPYMSKRELEEEIVGLLGGRVAEELVLQDVSTGASNDLQRATRIAHNMVSKYGMSDKLGAMVYDSENNEVFIGRSMGQARSYSEESAAAIDVEVRSIIDAAYEKCRSILNEHMDALERTARYLLEHETMSALEFERIFDPDATEAAESEALSRFAG